MLKMFNLRDIRINDQTANLTNPEKLALNCIRYNMTNNGPHQGLFAPNHPIKTFFNNLPTIYRNRNDVSINTIKNCNDLNSLINITSDLTAYALIIKLASLSEAEINDLAHLDLLRIVVSAIPNSFATMAAITQLTPDPNDNDMVQHIKLRVLLSNMVINSGFNILDFDHWDYNYTEFRSGTIQLLPDKKLGSDRIFLKIILPAPLIKSAVGKNIMGIDLGLRDLYTYSIRTKGIGIEGHETERPDILSNSDLIPGHSLTPDYHKTSKKLSRQSRFLQRASSKYQRYQKKHTSLPKLTDLSFDSDDKRFYYLYNLRKAISSNQQKRSNINQFTVHTATSDLLKLALRFEVKQFNFEDLVDFQSSTPAGARSWSECYSNNLFGQVMKQMEYKVKLWGYNTNDIVTCLPHYTSQLCPLGIIDRNQYVPNRIKPDPDDAGLESRQGLVHAWDHCRTYSIVKDELEENSMGKLFIHNYRHTVGMLPNSQVTLNRDVSAALVLTYCQNS